MTLEDDLEDAEALRRGAEDLRAGRIAPGQFRAIRLDRVCIYGHRGEPEEGRHTVRVKFPQGEVEPHQLEALAEVADLHAGGRGHLTTRQDMELHGPRLDSLAPVAERLARAGLTTRQTCGNTVRNTTLCPLAGVCPRECLDVSPYARALDRHWHRNPMARDLPRKFKVAFSGCDTDCALAQAHDIGAVATTREGQPGFRLHVGGGLGAQPRAALLFSKITPASDLFRTCEAILRVFSRHFDSHLDRRNRDRARMKFLLEKMGEEGFRTRWREEYDSLDGFTPPPLEPPRGAPEGGPRPPPAPERPAPGYARWRETNTEPQRQEGYVAVRIRLPAGDLTGAQMRSLASAARRHRLRLRATDTQGLVLLWAPADLLPSLHRDLHGAGLALAGAGRPEDVTACPGAETCTSAITRSGDLARALSERLAGKFDDLPGVTIKVSGCPNSCGRHMAAHIGLYGASRKCHGRDVPHYILLLGGGQSNGDLHFGRPAARIPARRVPQAVEALLRAYRERRKPGEDFRGFVERWEAAPPASAGGGATDGRPGRGLD